MSNFAELAADVMKRFFLSKNVQEDFDKILETGGDIAEFVKTQIRRFNPINTLQNPDMANKTIFHHMLMAASGVFDGKPFDEERVGAVIKGALLAGRPDLLHPIPSHSDKTMGDRIKIGRVILSVLGKEGDLAVSDFCSSLSLGRPKAPIGTLGKKELFDEILISKVKDNELDIVKKIFTATKAIFGRTDDIKYLPKEELLACAVRENLNEMVDFLCENGAHSPKNKVDEDLLVAIGHKNEFITRRLSFHYVTAFYCMRHFHEQKEFDDLDWFLDTCKEMNLRENIMNWGAVLRIIPSNNWEEELQEVYSGYEARTLLRKNKSDTPRKNKTL